MNEPIQVHNLNNTYLLGTNDIRFIAEIKDKKLGNCKCKRNIKIYAVKENNTILDITGEKFNTKCDIINT